MSNFLLIFGKPRYLGIVSFPDDQPPEKGEQWIVQSARGREIAIVTGKISPSQEQVYREIRKGESHDNNTRGGDPPLQDLKCLEPVTDEDLELAQEQRTDEDLILRQSREILRKHDLGMKLVDVEYLLDRKKLFFYFTAEQRIDFRAFVRDLAREFKTRIELRQIGIRDEAKVVEGLAPCGNPCCCSYWLNRFAPICIRMVKEQNLALNPTKISGLCGRLMCCMSYEHHNYHKLWETLPNPGSKIRAPQGTFILTGVDIDSEAVRILTPDRSELLVPVDHFQEFRDTIMDGKDWGTTPEETQLLETKPEEKISPVAQKARTSSKPEEGKNSKKSRKRPSRNNSKNQAPPGDNELSKTPAEGEKKKKRPPRKRRRKKKKISEGAPENNAENKTLNQSPAKSNVTAKTEEGSEEKKAPASRKRPRRRRRKKRPADKAAQPANKKRDTSTQDGAQKQALKERKPNNEQ